MKYSYTVLLFVLLGIGMLYFCIQYYQTNNMQKELVNILEKHMQQNLILSSSENNRMHECSKNGILINGNLSVSDIDGQEYTLNDLLAENTLILRYSETDCDLCVQEQIRILKNCQDSLCFRNVIFLTNYTNSIYMKRYFKAYHIPYKVFNMGEMLSKQIEDIGAPYYFMLNKKSMRINKMFVPAKERPELTKKYLTSIRELYTNTM